jgi:cell division protein ZapE
LTISPILSAYQLLLDKRGYSADRAQLSGVQRLDALAHDLAQLKAAQANKIKALFSKPSTPRGVWLWGGVGRGKSFIMDCFYAAAPTQRKTRIHFHEFMRSVHRQLEALKGTVDPLDTVAKNVGEKYQLLCFDEFHVSDVADAMILHRLLLGLFKHGVVFVMTSNYAPDKLYPDGLHRDRVLPAIALLKQNLDVLNIDAGIDYRKLAMEQVLAYWSPCDTQAIQQLTGAFNALAECDDETPLLNIENRCGSLSLSYVAAHALKTIIWSWQLCFIRWS